MALRHIHGNVWNVARTQKCQRSVTVPGVEPLGLTELDRDRQAEHALLDLFDVRKRARGRQEPRRKLKEDGAQLPSPSQWLHRSPEPLPGLVQELIRHLLEVDVLVPQVGGQLLPNVRRERHWLGRVVGEEREGLDVEREVRRRLGRPGLGVLGLGDSVVAGIDLDKWKLRRVEAQAVT